MMKYLYFPLTKEEAMAISEEEFEKMCVPEERVMIPFRNGLLAECDFDMFLQYLAFRYENALEFFKLEFGRNAVKDVKDRIRNMVVSLRKNDVDIHSIVQIIDASLVFILRAKRTAREKYTAKKYRKGA